MLKYRIAQRFALLIRRIPGVLVIGNAIWRLIQPRYTVGAVGVIFNANGDVLLAAHAFHTVCRWGLPGGWVDRNEDPAVAVRREMMEELSLDVKVGPIVLVEKPYRNHLDLAYLCRALGSPGPLSYELLEYGWFDLESLPEILGVHYRAISRAKQQMQLMGFEQ